ncbi:unnamed protein product, partial [Discosporangium mesarthrocarpum]
GGGKGRRSGLPMSLLHGHVNGIFLLETLHESFLYFTRQCQEDHRDRALSWAQGQHVHQSYRFITVVEEGIEPTVFKERFENWEHSRKSCFGKPSSPSFHHRTISAAAKNAPRRRL